MFGTSTYKFRLLFSFFTQQKNKSLSFTAHHVDMQLVIIKGVKSYRLKFEY